MRKKTVIDIQACDEKIKDAYLHLTLLSDIESLDGINFYASS